MRISEFHPPDQIIAHPKCAECGVPMWLVRVEPYEADHDQRTFECYACHNTTTEIVKYR